MYLANPPYVGQKSHKDVFDRLRQQPHWPPWLTPKSDLLYLFFHLAFDLLHPTGIAGLLTTAYFAQAAGAFRLRKRLQEQATLRRLIDFGETKLFARAKGHHNIITVFSTRPQANGLCVCGTENPVLRNQTDLFFGPQLFLNTRPPQAVLQTVLSKMENSACILQDVAAVSNGLMTGCDKAFILTATTRKSLPLTPT